MVISDPYGLLLLASTYAANHHEITFLQWYFDFFMAGAMP